MIITLILLLAMLGAIVLATGSVEEDKTAAAIAGKSVGSQLILFRPARVFAKAEPPEDTWLY